LPKFTAVGNIAVGADPVPLSATVNGLFEALEVMVRVPVGIAPKVVGVAVTDTLHVAPLASVAPHVFPEIANADGVVTAI
jgi:hypothetical protein